MDQTKKREAILEYIAKHNEEFLRQAKIKINWKFATSKIDNVALVSDIIFTIVNKLDDVTNVNRYFDMIKDNMLFNYICKAISINGKFLTSPFIQDKLKQRNRIVILQDYEYFKEEENDEEYEFENEVLTRIFELLEPENAKALLGERWQYFVTIFKEYYNTPRATYESLAKKYDIPKPTIALNIMTIKKAIFNKLKDEKLLLPNRKLTYKL